MILQWYALIWHSINCVCARLSNIPDYQTATTQTQVLRVTPSDNAYFSHIFISPCSVSKVTRYGPDGPGIESRWGGRFFAPVQTGPGAPQPPIQWVLGLSWG
jgi:hypothetical protein